VDRCFRSWLTLALILAAVSLSLPARAAGAKDAAADVDAVTCCPAQGAVFGCAVLGGAAVNGQCLPSCDFWCTTNWRTRLDQYGCPVMVFDFRSPAPGEDFLCNPDRDASVDASGG